MKLLIRELVDRVPDFAVALRTDSELPAFKTGDVALAVGGVESGDFRLFWFFGLCRFLSTGWRGRVASFVA